jgi:hypothetical protein
VAKSLIFWLIVRERGFLDTQLVCPTAMHVPNWNIYLLASGLQVQNAALDR